MGYDGISLHQNYSWENPPDGGWIGGVIPKAVNSDEIRPDPLEIPRISHEFTYEIPLIPIKDPIHHDPIQS
jgi:hypothetical protein